MLKIEVDETIMNDLLSQPTVAKDVLKMTPETLRAFKELLVSEGIYSQYVLEYKNKHQESIRK